MRWAVPLTGRDPAQVDRTVSPLELFYDLVSVIAVALAIEAGSSSSPQGIRERLQSLALIFFARPPRSVNSDWALRRQAARPEAAPTYRSHSLRLQLRRLRGRGEIVSGLALAAVRCRHHF